VDQRSITGLKRLRVFSPGLVPYDLALAAQRACVERLKRTGPRASGEAFLFLLEHPPVITVGRGGKEQNILVPAEVLRRQGVALRHVGRGGDVTYHGPGQVVGYPVLRLEGWQRDVHAYLRRLEQVLMETLQEFGIASRRREGYTGVWVGEEKVAAIGVAITRWITYHGFALNVSPRLEHFALIHPCGITDRRVTSMERILGRRVDAARVREDLVKHFVRHFGFEVVSRSASLPVWARPAESHEASP